MPLSANYCKVVLLKTFFKHEWNFQFDPAVACDFFMQLNLPAG
jgi:hypothetical protein